MTRYLVNLTSSAAKELDVLSGKMITRIIAELEDLAITPRPQGCKKLKGGTIEYRIRVGDYRVIYEIHDKQKTIDITRIAHRRDVYR